MTIKEKPLAAGQADQQGASNNYTKDTPSSLVGQGEASQGNHWKARPAHSPTSNLFLISGFILYPSSGQFKIIISVNFY